jgi:hypothetical protein
MIIGEGYIGEDILAGAVGALIRWSVFLPQLGGPLYTLAPGIYYGNCPFVDGNFSPYIH